MGRKVEFIGSERILSKLYRDLGLSEISEIDVIEWIGEALESIGTITLYEKAITFIEVTNYRAELPQGTHSILQIVKNNSPHKKDYCNPCHIKVDYNECECEEEIECCDECGDIDWDTPAYGGTYRGSYFTLLGTQLFFSMSHIIKRQFEPVRLSNHSFFNTMVCPEDPQIYIEGCSSEYTIEGKTLKFSFPTGQVAIVYYRQKVDDNGFPMIPDENSVIEAITWYITWKYFTRLYYMGRDGMSEKLQYAEKQWVWYCKQASNKAMMPYGVDEYQNLLEERYKPVPNHRYYYGFFNRLGKK